MQSVSQLFTKQKEVSRWEIWLLRFLASTAAAVKLSLPCLPKNLVSTASEDSGINERLFGMSDEKIRHAGWFKTLSRPYTGELLPPEDKGFVSDDNLFNYQAKTIKELAEKGIGIEMCPISNLQTKAVAGPEKYPIREFLNGGLKVTVNTDNRTVSDTTMTKELEFIQNTYGIQDDEIYLLMKNAADVAFAEDYVKDKLYRIMREVYGA